GIGIAAVTSAAKTFFVCHVLLSFFALGRHFLGPGEGYVLNLLGGEGLDARTGADLGFVIDAGLVAAAYHFGDQHLGVLLAMAHEPAVTLAGLALEGENLVALAMIQHFELNR